MQLLVRPGAPNGVTPDVRLSLWRRILEAGIDIIDEISDGFVVECSAADLPFLQVHAHRFIGSIERYRPMSRVMITDPTFGLVATHIEMSKGQQS